MCRQNWLSEGLLEGLSEELLEDLLEDLSEDVSEDLYEDLSEELRDAREPTSPSRYCLSRPQEVTIQHLAGRRIIPGEVYYDPPHAPI